MTGTFNINFLYLKRQWPDNPTPLWKGADIINKQRSQLAINNLKQQYCQPLLSTTSTTSAQAGDQSTTSASIASKLTESRPTTLTSDPYQLQPPTLHVTYSRLQGTMENNAKAEKLQQYISDKHKKHLTEVFKTFYLYNYFTTFSTHISAQLYTHYALIYTFDVSYITLFFLLFLYQLNIN